MLRIFIGYDPAETVAYHVLCHSILRQASKPVSFTPINKRNIQEFNRGIEDGSTEFSFSRFLTPYLAMYHGPALFLDCDMLVRGDIHDIMEYYSPDKALSVVKHDYTPKPGVKFLGNTQHIYPKKNWSSVMLFNAGHKDCRNLSVEAVNSQSGAYLHQLKWTEEDQVNEMPVEWNHLVGEYEPNPDARIVHYTLGTPCFKGYEDQEWSKEWFEEMEIMLHAD